MIRMQEVAPYGVGLETGLQSNSTAILCYIINMSIEMTCLRWQRLKYCHPFKGYIVAIHESLHLTFFYLH